MWRFCTSKPVILAAAAAFVAIAWRVRKKQFLPFDRDALPYVGVREEGADRVSWFAEPTRLVIGAAVVAALWPGLSRRDRAGLVAAPLLAAGFGEIAKHLVPRERPNKTRFTPNGGQSFPSTHSACATAFGLACAAVAERHGYGRWTYFTAVGLGVWIGVERIRDAAHWPTDVFGGLSLGLMSAGAALSGS